MKNARIILKSGIVAFTVFVFCSSGFAQSNKETVKVKSVSVTPIEKSGHVSQIGTHQNVQKATLNPKLEAQKRGAVTVANNGNSARNCTTKPKTNPYAMSRSVFNSLPKDRQQYVLEHSDKYTVVD